MINIIFSIVLASISVAQLNIFEVDGIFSSAHVRSVERHFEEFEYEKNDLFIVQYSSKQFSSEKLEQFNNLILSQDFYTALWVGPYKVDLDFDTINSFDFVGYTPGVNLIDVEFTDSIEAQYCTINFCNYENRTISIVNQEGIYEGYIVVGSLGSFIENLSSENILSNLSGQSININLSSDESSSEIEFIKPSLIERFYISISNPIFTYLFFVLGFALIGLELFAIGPGLMAFIGGSLVIFSTMPFQEFGINYFGVILFIISFLVYLKILSRGYFSLLGIGAFILLYLSSILMFRDYEIEVNQFLLGAVSLGLAFFYFIAIPTVIRSRLTTDTSAMTSFEGSKGKIIEILDNDAVLVEVNKLKIRVDTKQDSKYKVNEEYIIKEEEGNLII